MLETYTKRDIFDCFENILTDTSIQSQILNTKTSIKRACFTLSSLKE